MNILVVGEMLATRRKDKSINGFSRKFGMTTSVDKILTDTANGDCGSKYSFSSTVELDVFVVAFGASAMFVFNLRGLYLVEKMKRFSTTCVLSRIIRRSPEILVRIATRDLIFEHSVLLVLRYFGPIQY